ncbi:uncharacterized protein LACBIDRAFT_315364 [Laccaria bicolor S238N-H82]|uniref:Predicted protein n=1 Tax=Laccaria bicolor (strain S238N-H82 / ATCC MYA-4686) TaxID=486041 RepID=B0D284_LACBS|nr:uncharacterized protein LACBIDRAFT_315364 [Laccaria bicolor S238N-H82]EDR10699.1 predicted protein [Laccaria bicolor S238N-H82]|eukprot:XP_001878000.1 predicted protein [Laccaria bicolor S238N-H82]
MHLYLSSNEPWNATYANEEGQPIYKTSSPRMVLSRKISVHKIIPNASEEDLQDRFAHLAEVEYKRFTPSRIRYGGDDLLTSEYFRKTKEWGDLGKGRIFTGPDGKEYKWKLGMRVPELVTNDRSERPVAIYRRGRIGVVREARPPSLEILPEAEHMVDLIVVTFVYIEKLRMDRDNQSQHMVTET